MEIVNSAMGMIGSIEKAENKTATSGQYQDLKTEREAQEQAQLQQEADELRRSREKVTEARDLKAKRAAVNSNRKTTLGNGGAGLIDDPDVDVPQLKTKFGE